MRRVAVGPVGTGAAPATRSPAALAPGARPRGGLPLPRTVPAAKRRGGTGRGGGPPLQPAQPPSSSDGPARPSPTKAPTPLPTPPPTAAAVPPPPPAPPGKAEEEEEEVMKLHEELLEQIEERKRLQAALVTKLHEQAQRAGACAVAGGTEPFARTHAPGAGSAPMTTTTAPAEPPSPSPSPPSSTTPTPPAGENVMNLVFVASECAPWSKTGGLGDVMAALPKALARRGHRVMAVAPRYAEYAEGWETGVRLDLTVFNTTVQVGFFHGFIDGVDWVFVDHPAYHHRSGGEIYGGDRTEVAFRCALLSKAAIEAARCVPCGGIPYGEDNLCFIANDWHAALVPVYLQDHYREHGQFNYARAILVIHNLAHQGRGPPGDADLYGVGGPLRGEFAMDDPVGGKHSNIMRAGIVAASRVVAVSHGYAWECQTMEGGWGLDGVLREASWKFRGIVNGIDYSEWSPQADAFLDGDGYSRYDPSTPGWRAGKAACKAALQAELGLPVNPDAPLLAFIGRLDHQKGADLIMDSFDWLMGEGCQLVLLGSGRHDLEDGLRRLEGARPDQCRAWVGFSVAMAHRMTAGADMLLMPSRFEPCGLNQLYAMAYGTVPIVHAVGGLRDTVSPFNPFDDTGTGWTFDRADGRALRDAVANALHTYRAFRPSFDAIGQRGADQDLSWDVAAATYEEVLVAAKYQW